jgi:enoyl-CoA hydratase/carnithine racemase
VAEIVAAPPWPPGPIVVDLDRIGDVSAADLEALEARGEVTVGAVSGCCEGAALAAALAVDLLVAAPTASFGRAGAWSDLVVRRGTGIAGRKVAAYLSVTQRLVSAEQARVWGIVSRVDGEPAAAAAALADEVGARSARAVRTILRQAHRGATADYVQTRLTARTD